MGVEIVDTPGTGSIYEHNSEEAQRALETLDAAVVVLIADPPASAAERDLLCEITRHSVMTFVLLNKADRLDSGERAEALAFTTDVVRAAAGPTGAGIPVYAVSARAALPGGTGDDGFQAFTAGFAGYLDGRRSADPEQAVAGHARRAAQRLLDEVRLAQRMSQMRTGDAAARVELFRDRLAAIALRRQDGADLIAGEQRRLLAGLNEFGGAGGCPADHGDRQGLISFLGNELHDAGPGEIEQRGHEWLVARARDGAEAWRDQQRNHLEGSLAELDTRLLAGLAGELGKIRDAARELLDLDLTVPDTGERLVPDRRFFYTGTDVTGQTELLAGAVRRRLPGQLGQRRSRQHLLEQASDLAPKLTGRARSDLQYRLEESGRRMTHAVGQRYADSIGRLVRVVDSAVADSAGEGPTPPVPQQRENRRPRDQHRDRHRDPRTPPCAHPHMVAVRARNRAEHWHERTPVPQNRPNGAMALNTAPAARGAAVSKDSVAVPLNPGGHGRVPRPWPRDAAHAAGHVPVTGGHCAVRHKACGSDARLR